MEDNGETLTLWGKLKRDGFTLKEFKRELAFMSKVKNFFGANIQPIIYTNNDFLIKEINGKIVEVFGIDIWYTRATVDGEVIFDDRRFDDQELFDAIFEATKMKCDKKCTDKCICETGESGWCQEHHTDIL